jgi:hypothetical protein
MNYYLFYELLFDLPLVTWNHGGRWAAQGAGAVGLVPGSWGRAAAEPVHGPVRVISPCTAFARARPLRIWWHPLFTKPHTKNEPATRAAANERVQPNTGMKHVPRIHKRAEAKS